MMRSSGASCTTGRGRSSSAWRRCLASAPTTHTTSSPPECCTWWRRPWGCPTARPPTSGQRDSSNPAPDPIRLLTGSRCCPDPAATAFSSPRVSDHSLSPSPAVRLETGEIMTESTILVVGAGGVVGPALVPALTARGVRVRAMTRDPQRRFGGAQTAVGDLRVPSSFGPALDGVDTVFLNTPSTEDAAELQIRFAEVAARSSVRRIVLLSQYGAEVGSPVRFLRWHAEVEEHLRTLSPALTVLRPNLYLQSLLGFASTIAA